MRLAVVPGAVVLLGVLGACSLGGTQHTAASATKSSASPSAVTTYNPLAGPVEAASQLPKTCSAILSDTDLATSFGAPQTGDTAYGNYAPLPNIGRTGRVTCGFGIGIDQLGHSSPASVTVSVITYNTAGNAVSRIATDVDGSVAKGDTTQPALVDGHPATILFAPGTTQQSASPSASAGATGSASASPSASASATAAATGDTELLMADGNRTFVIQIPLTKLSGSGAVNVLISVAGLVYRHTLPPGGSASPSATKTAAASPSPSAS